MPTNSQILIDGFISDEFSKQTEYSSKGDYFELLASSRYMAPYDLDDDEIAEGLIGGSRDGGCDAIYIFANNYFLSEDVQIQNYINRGSRVEIVILQTKVSKSFKEDAFLKWKDTCNDLYFRSVPNSLTITNQLASSTASLSAPTLMQA